MATQKSTELSVDKLELIQFTVNSFMGIDKSKPVVLDFTEKSHKKKPIVLFEGNQAVGKSSMLNALLYAMGEELGFKKENIINSVDETINLEFTFKSGKSLYRVKATKGKFSLDLFNDEHDVWTGLSEPKELLKKLLGNIATDPLFLKEQSGKKQIEWIRKTFSREHTGPGRKPREETLIELLETASVARTNANRDRERLEKSLLGDEFYQNYEQNQNRFTKPVSVEASHKRFQAAQNEKNKLDNASRELSSLNDTKVQQLNLIQQLEEQLKQANANYEKTLKRIEDSGVWVKENSKTITAEYDASNTEYQNISKEAADYERWKSVVERKKELDEYETAVIQLDSKKGAMKTELLELTRKYLPDIEGLEIKVATGLDDKSEGLFYNGKTMAQVSESEFATIIMGIYEHNEASFVILENINRFGSGAIEMLNALAKKGVRIFASQQARKVKALNITFTDKIE